MDLYDLRFYFSLDVPIRALSSPLLKAAVCAYTAKHLSRVNVNSKAGPPSSPRSTTMWPEADQVDWAVLGARYYASAINLLRETLKEPHLLSFSSNPSPRDQEISMGINMKTSGCCQTESAATPEAPISTIGLDEVLAATAILCVYEHISASESAWSGHLSGTRMLLNMAKFGLMPSTMASEHTDGIRPSKARKSIFWNFVRQDFLAACKVHLIVFFVRNSLQLRYSHHGQSDTYQYRRSTHLEGSGLTVGQQRKNRSQACFGK
jgi:hypothetical protein